MDASRVLLGVCLCLLLPSASPATDADSFCPERCDCAQPRRLLCANRGLRAVPAPAARHSGGARTFSLAGNFIPNISASDFSRYGDLVGLNLQFNRISHIHPKAFEELSQLRELFLGHNLLTAVAAGTLQPLKKLAVLYGNNNALRTITAELFSDLDGLVRLRLDGNAIEVLQDSAFKSLTSLHYLHLEHNKVQHVHRDAFSTLTELRFLNLAHNKQTALTSLLTFSPLRALTTLLLSENEIQHVGNHVFQNLKKLSKLSLSNNRISRLDGGALKGLSSLKEFLIDGNKLEEVPTGLLDPLVRIERLDFSRNRISNVNSTAFSKLKYLKVLRLSHNFLSSLSGHVFALNNVLSDLDLRGNNWTCDCRLEELKRWMSAAHAQGKLLAVFLQCHYPASLRGRYLDHVNSSQLQLPGNWSPSCKSGPGPEESRGRRVLMKVEGEKRGELYAALDEEAEMDGRNRTEMEKADGLRQGDRDGTVIRREGEKKERARQEAEGDQEGAEPLSFPEETKTEQRHSAEAAAKRPKGRRRSNVVANMKPATTSKPSHETDTSSPVRSREKFDFLRSDQEETLAVITDPCVFNRHFITNVSVDEVTSTTVSVHWTTRAHPHHSTALQEVHYRILFDRFGTADRFPRYVYAPGVAHSVTLRELTSGVTYIVCVEGVVGGSVCLVAPRDHCAGLVTLPEVGRRSATLTSDLQLVTVATLVGNGVLLLVISGVWVGRILRRRLQRRKSTVHVRHMYSTRRPFRPGTVTASMSTDFTSYQSDRPTRLAPLEEGDLIEFPCDRFLDSCGARRDNSMQRFSD